MKIEKGFYKDIPAYILTTDTLEAIILAEDGAKMASLRSLATGREFLLQREGEHYRRIGYTDGFEGGECSGFDDMFPSIDPERLVNARGETYEYPDHGELARVGFSAEVKDGTLILAFRSERFNYEVKKCISEGEDGSIVMSYEIKNTDTIPLRAQYTAHCLVNAEDGGKILLPFGPDDEVDLLFDTSGTLAVGERVAFDEALLFSDRTARPSRCEKYYFPKDAPEGYIGYRYVNGESIVMRFNPEVLSCLGIWHNLEGLLGDYCVGLEPSTAGYDTVEGAERYGRDVSIAPSETVAFSLTLEAKKRINI